jgi:hypothetical protein
MGYVGPFLFIAMILSAIVSGVFEVNSVGRSEYASTLQASLGMLLCISIGFSIAALRDFLPVFYLTLGFAISRQSPIWDRDPPRPANPEGASL